MINYNQFRYVEDAISLKKAMNESDTYKNRPDDDFKPREKRKEERKISLPVWDLNGKPLGHELLGSVVRGPTVDKWLAEDTPVKFRFGENVVYGIVKPKPRGLYRIGIYVEVVDQDIYKHEVEARHRKQVVELDDNSLAEVNVRKVVDPTSGSWIWLWLVLGLGIIILLTSLGYLNFLIDV